VSEWETLAFSLFFLFFFIVFVYKKKNKAERKTNSFQNPFCRIERLAEGSFPNSLLTKGWRKKENFFSQGFFATGKRLQIASAIWVFPRLFFRREKRLLRTRRLTIRLRALFY